MTRLNFLDSIRQHHVGLESVHISSLTITGSVLVHNICFQKKVKVRYSRDYWLSHEDITAEFSNSLAPDLDKFSFRLTVTGCPGSLLEFCVCAELGEDELWDNNSGKNYQVECLLLPPPNPLFQNNPAKELSTRQGPSSSANKRVYY